MPCQIKNNSKFDITEIKGLIQDLHDFSQRRLGFKKPPVLNLMSDINNMSPLGKTAHYDPNSMEITIFVDGRHPKDIMRSFSHELVHHCQNENGMFDNIEGESGDGYAQSNSHLRKMEKEAYLKGNMCFRDWEDGYKSSNPNILNERRIYKMSTKDWKDKELKTLLNEKWGFSMDLSKLNESSCGSGKKDDKKEIEEDMGKLNPGLRKYIKDQQDKKSNDDEEDQEESEEKEKSGSGKLKMVKHPKTGKMVPDYVVDGKGKNDQAKNEGINEAKIEDMSESQIQSLLKIFQDMGGTLPDGKDIADFARDIKNHDGKEEKDSEMDMKERKLRETVKKIIKSKLRRK